MTVNLKLHFSMNSLFWNTFPAVTQRDWKLNKSLYRLEDSMMEPPISRWCIIMVVVSVCVFEIHMLTYVANVYLHIDRQA
jgi:hypothetical protein